MKKTTLLLCLATTLLACNEVKNSSKVTQTEDNFSEKKLTTAESIAYKNGFENWKNVSEISFTFNVARGEKHFERTWNWKPQTNDVLMITEKDTVSYNRATMDSISKKTDAAFINDKYWLLAPFNLVWDEGLIFSEKENVIAPISKDTLKQLTAVYGNNGGYTPGDAYDFYFGKDYSIKEWVYRKGNDSLPSVITTWEDYEIFNEITIAKTHKDSTGSFKVYFTDISVR